MFVRIEGESVFVRIEGACVFVRRVFVCAGGGGSFNSLDTKLSSCSLCSNESLILEVLDN